MEIPVRARSSSIFSLLLLIALSSGCAITYTDAQGAKHVLGLVKLEIKPSAPEQTIGETVHVQSIGVAVYSTPLNRGVAIGYNRETTAAIRNQTPARIGQIQAADAEAKENQ